MNALAVLCLGAWPSLIGATVPTKEFTLAWTHSVEKIRWEEDWRVTDDSKIVPVAARIQGSGAGMEPPPDAVLRDGWYHYSPRVAPLAHVTLRRSGLTRDYTICWDGQCRPMEALLPPGPDGTDLFACPSGTPAR